MSLKINAEYYALGDDITQFTTAGTDIRTVGLTTWGVGPDFNHAK